MGEIVNEILQSALQQLVGPANWVDSQALGGLPAAGNPVSGAVVLDNPPRRAVEQLREEGFARLHRFVVLPSSKAPRWLLPLGDRHGMLGGFHIYTPYARVPRMLKAAAERFIKAGWAGWGCPRVVLASKEPLPLEVLATKVTGERQPMLALSLGMPGDLCKLTVQVMGAHGKILSYIKLPVCPQGVPRVENEAAVLKCLWAFPELRPHIPRVLYAGEWSGGFVLVQSPGPLCPGPVEFGPLHERFLRLLRTAYRIDRPGAALIEEVSARWRKIEPLLDGGCRELGERVLGTASEALDGAVIPCGIVHGDLVPWNTRVENGQLFVFDWESAAWGLPTLWDEFHFHVQVASLLNAGSGRHFPPKQTRVAGALFLVYVINSLCQYIEGKAPPGVQVVEYRKRLLAKTLST